MNLNGAYLDYSQHPNSDTLTALYTALRSYASNVAHSYHLRDADDATSEAVVRSWEHLSEYDSTKGKFSSWFHSYVKHCVFEQFRENSRTLPLESGYEPTRGPGPEPVTVSYRIGSVEHRLVDLLLDGKTVKSASDAVGVSETTARRRLRKLKK